MSTVSVAMATYNGEKYIREQLMSILNQTVLPDEIIISDDGSKDRTLEIIREIQRAECSRGGDRIVLLTDNPRHGCGGNFQWALEHTTKEIIFLCAQDDVWKNNKIERITSVYSQYPNALCVMHDVHIIDSDGKVTSASFYPQKADYQTEFKRDGIWKISKSELERSFTSLLFAGAAISLSAKLIPDITPIPVYAEDGWIEFVSLFEGQCYYLDEKLMGYRKHDTNTGGTGSKGFRKVHHIVNKISSPQFSRAFFQYQDELSSSVLRFLRQHGAEGTPEYQVADHIQAISRVQADAFGSGRFRGASMLIALFRSDLRYRRTGTSAFLYQLVAVLTKNTGNS